MPVSALTFRPALATNATGTTYTVRNTTTTEPSGAGVFDLFDIAVGVGGRGTIPEWLQLVPFGTAADNKTFAMRLTGYNATIPTASLAAIYIPQLLLDISVTLCGITATDIAASTFLADTIAVNSGGSDGGGFRSLINAVTNSADTPASVLVHTRGCRYIRFDFDADAGASASTDCNCLWRAMNNVYDA